MTSSRMAPLQRAVYWRLSLVFFFTAFSFFLDVFTVRIGLCVSGEPFKRGDRLDQRNHSNIKTADVNFSHSVSPTSLAKWNGTANENNTVCVDDEVLSYGQTMYMSGLLLGSLFGGALSDRYGKRLVFLVCVCLHAVGALLPAALPHALLYLTVRCLTGVACCCINICSFSLGVEWSLPKSRVWPPALLSFSFSLGMMALAPLAYCLRSWVHLHLALGLPQLLCLPLYICIPESPRWLQLRGKTDILEKYRRHSSEDKLCLDQLLDTAWSNPRNPDEKVHTPETDTHTPETDTHTPETDTHTPETDTHTPETDTHTAEIDTHTPETDTHTAETDTHTAAVHTPETVCSYLSSRTILQRLCIMSYIGLASALTYFGICMNVGSFGVDVYLAQFFSGLSETPCMLVPFLLARCGRRPISMLSLLLSGFACLMSLLVSHFCDIPALVMTLAMAGKLCMQITVFVSLLYSIELFPTVIRQKCVGLVNLCYRVGCILNTVVSPRGEIPLAAMIVYGSGPIIGAGLCLLLPETSGLPLPDSVEDCDRQPSLQLSTLLWLRACCRRHSLESPDEKATPFLEKDPETAKWEGNNVFTYPTETHTPLTAICAV
ncbi:si:dkey-190l8.2 isoform X1 [Osmerus eperlanus]|uniref:si:dkey-190l8.2 isoform X1 n=2 Tax=Osmerus eperlanus TaxID=29151 RepID=UPI002E12AB95